MKSNELLQDIETATLSILKVVEKNFAPLSSEALNQKPNPQKWSIAECLEHLNYYSSYYNKEIKTALENAKQKQWKAVPIFSSTWLGKKSIAAVHPSNTKATQTPKALNPSLSSVQADVIPRFIAAQNEFLTLIRSAQNINLNKTKVRIEVFKLLKLRLGDLFLFIVAHNQRHCNQALKLRNFEANLGLTNA